MSAIARITAREILDSRGVPALETDVRLQSGAVGRASVPSGASKGVYEALELRDGDEKRFFGMGVLRAAEHINRVIAGELCGKNVFDQRELDGIMIRLDGTRTKANLGANAILCVSLALARAAANEAKTPLYRYLGGIGAHLLPTPMVNIINGGRHAANSVDLQEFMLVPTGARTMQEAIRTAAEIFHTLKYILKRDKRITSVGDEGGFAPDITNEEALDYILKAIESAGYIPGGDVYIALDCAASELYKASGSNGYAFWKSDPESRYSGAQLRAIYEQWLSRYPIISIEDPFDENDWNNHALLTASAAGKAQIVGDDLFATNKERLEKGIAAKACNSIIVKPNQVGTLSETFDAIECAHKAGYTAIISHRSGETEDTFIADLAVASGAGLIKTGSMSRGERTCKYNRLLRIESSLKGGAYAGISAFRGIKRA